MPESPDQSLSSADIKNTLPHPKVVEAQASSNGQQRLDYYKNSKGDISVKVDYPMKIGDSVRVKWFGANTTFTTDKIVETPGNLAPFFISRYEVIDVIDRNATLSYTVLRNGNLEQSFPLEFIVTGASNGHNFEIRAPTIDDSHTNLRVQIHDQFNSNSTAQVRCIGGDYDQDTWDFAPQTFGTASHLDFNHADQAWLNRNRGRRVKFNWSLKINPGDNLLFSRRLIVEKFLIPK